MDNQTIRFKREERYEKVWSKSMNSPAKEWGTSDVGLARICKRSNTPKLGLVIEQNERSGSRLNDKHPTLQRHPQD